MTIGRNFDIILIEHVKNGDLSKAKMMLDLGANPNATTDDGEFCPLVIAICNKDIDMIKLLIDYGAVTDLKLKYIDFDYSKPKFSEDDSFRVYPDTIEIIETPFEIAKKFFANNDEIFNILGRN
jgi:ankyrin repeat protein